MPRSNNIPTSHPRTSRTGRLTTLLLLAAVLTISACMSVTGKPVPSNDPTTGDPPEYAAELSDDDRATLAYFAMIRSLDPCGFLDETAMQKLGVLRKFDASQSPGDCEAWIEVDRDSNKQLEVRTTIYPKDNGYAKKAKPITVAGQQIAEAIEYGPGEAKGNNSCRNLIPFDDRSSLFIQVFRRTNDAPCAEAHRIVEASLGLLHRRPQRMDSTKKARHAVSLKDPCEALGTLSEEHQITLSSGTQVRECSFQVGSAADARTIKLDWTTLSTYDNPYGGRQTTVEGRKAIESQPGRTCRVEVFVPDPSDGIQYDPVGDPRYTSSTVAATAKTCAIATETASLAVRTFLQ
ncbi:hypothetical protein [Nocardia sp. NPDC050710]|uniref:hypothetical protein n=1 Tax=Nocardia sp. NPDC050710 TaxID=3157220 RepID=UPI0033DBBE53